MHLPTGELTYPDENYTQLLSGKDVFVPYLVVSAQIESAYNQSDYRSVIDNNFTKAELTVVLYRQDNTPVYAERPNLALNQTWTGTSNRVSIRNGQRIEVLFFLVPSSFDFDHFEIFVSQLQPTPQT